MGKNNIRKDIISIIATTLLCVPTYAQKITLGSCTTSNGGQYKGEMVSGKPYGKGNVVYKNGDTFTGCYNNGKKEGTFIFFCKKKNQQTYFYYKNNEFIETIDD